MGNFMTAERHPLDVAGITYKCQKNVSVLEFILHELTIVHALTIILFRTCESENEDLSLLVSSKTALKAPMRIAFSAR